MPVSITVPSRALAEQILGAARHLARTGGTGAQGERLPACVKADGAAWIGGNLAKFRALVADVKREELKRAEGLWAFASPGYARAIGRKANPDFDAFGPNHTGDLAKVFSWQTRVGLAPAFGSRPIGWYQQDQMAAYDEIMRRVKAIGGDIRQVKAKKHQGGLGYTVFAKKGNRWVVLGTADEIRSAGLRKQNPKKNPKTVNTGWRNVTPGKCLQCGSDDDWQVDGRGNVLCSCQACPDCGIVDAYGFHEPGCSQVKENPLTPRETNHVRAQIERAVKEAAKSRSSGDRTGDFYMRGRAAALQGVVNQFGRTARRANPGKFKITPALDLAVRMAVHNSGGDMRRARHMLDVAWADGAIGSLRELDIAKAMVKRQMAKSNPLTSMEAEGGLAAARDYLHKAQTLKVSQTRRAFKAGQAHGWARATQEWAPDHDYVLLAGPIAGKAYALPSVDWNKNPPAPLKCPECGEAARRGAIRREGWALQVDANRLQHVHLDGTPLCPVMTSKGYQPALPVTDVQQNPLKKGAYSRAFHDPAMREYRRAEQVMRDEIPWDHVRDEWAPGGGAYALDPNAERIRTSRDVEDAGCRRCKGVRQVRLGARMVACPTCCRKPKVKNPLTADEAKNLLREGGHKMRSMPWAGSSYPDISRAFTAGEANGLALAVGLAGPQNDEIQQMGRELRGQARTNKMKAMGLLPKAAARDAGAYPGEKPRRNSLDSHKPGCRCIFHSGKMGRKGGRV